MTFSLRHIILLIGTLIVITSFLFFGRDTETYDILLILGLVITTISLLVVVFKKDTTRNKIIWTVILIGCVGVQRLTEPLLIKLSYIIFVKSNDSRLDRLNNIVLAKKNGDLLFIPNSDKAVLTKFTDYEITEIQQLLSGTNISLILKDDQRVFYRTFGMIDISHGVYYFYGKDKPSTRFKHILGNWYY